MRLQWMPSSCSRVLREREREMVQLAVFESHTHLAAWMPSQVEASLIRTLSFPTPACLYSSMNLRALAMEASLLKESLQGKQEAWPHFLKSRKSETDCFSLPATV